ncbi:MAG: ABC transporter substrate-binding protein [Acidobacteria bacterium]|nr:ABC transporter substrate-binding protein [Acidobacteriota bacterium]
MPALLLAFLMACGGRTSPTSGEVVLTIGYAAPDGLDQLTAMLTSDLLIHTGTDGSAEPMLANGWSVTGDGRSVTVDLREDVLFHDGGVLTAADAKATLDRLRGLRDHLARNPILEDIEAIVVEGPHRIRIDLTRPSAQLLLLALGVGVEKTGLGDQSMGTGPFYIETQGPDETTLRAHDRYYMGRSDIDKVVIKTYASVRMAWAAMMRSEIDLLFDVPIEAREFVEADTNVQLFSRETPYAYVLIFNTRRPPFDDYRLRVALSHAIDRQSIVDRALRGWGSVATGVWPSHWVYRGREFTYNYDPDRVHQQLSDLGLIARSQNDPANTSFSSRLRFTAIVAEGQPQFEPIALHVQRQLGEIGVDMDIDSKPPTEMDRQVAGTDWDAAFLSLNTGRSLGRLFVFWHSSGSSAVSGFGGADVPLDSLRSAVSKADAISAAGAFQRTLFGKAPAIFLANRETTRAVSRRFVVPDEPGRDVIETLWRWRLTDDSSVERATATN